MRSAAFNSPEQFSACTVDGRRTACLGAQKCGHAFAVGGGSAVMLTFSFPFVSYIHLSGGWGPRNLLLIKCLALQYGSHATRPSTVRHGTYQKHPHMF